MIIDAFYINFNMSFVTFRYLAAGDAITTIAYNFWTGVSAARKIILDVCTATWGCPGTNIYVCAIRR